ncbi:hypothetical protein GCM10008967_20490 [Bacillus carboniphilus]|uniref:Amino acid transporter n=1 Tax=Bacillus carboniphilus TaxID=86663 RepID=A0ABP3G0T1_9BACI
MKKFEEDPKPFNDAMDHLHKVEGISIQNTDMSKLPKGLRYFGYFMTIFFTISILFIIVGILLQKLNE